MGGGVVNFHLCHAKPNVAKNILSNAPRTWFRNSKNYFPMCVGFGFYRRKREWNVDFK